MVIGFTEHISGQAKIPLGRSRGFPGPPLHKSRIKRFTNQILGVKGFSYQIKRFMEGSIRLRLLTLLCYGAMMSLAIGVNLLPVFLTSLSLTFGGQEGLSQEELGRLGAISFIGLVLGILIAGPASDRWGAKGFAIGGNGIMVFSLIGMSLAPNYGVLGLAVFWLGFGAGILDMILSPVVAVLNPDRRSAAMNWLHSFYCVGAVVTILGSTVALQIGFSWRHACFLLLPLPLVLLAAFALLRFPALVADSETGGEFRCDS
jgi:MFS family permease